MVFDFERCNNQEAYTCRCEWGEEGLRVLAPITDVIIIVDVLSFTTSIDLITSQGALAFPYRYKDDSVYDYAKEVNAKVGSEDNPDGFTLSPRTLENIPQGYRMVLPSPNGSTLSLATCGKPTFAGCLRNAEAVAHAAMAIGGSIAVIPSGERWEDNSLRPAVEDQIGAGAILSFLQGTFSSEAQAAIDIFHAQKDNLENFISGCSSGKEKHLREGERDIFLAAQRNVSSAVPKLQDGAYRDCSS